MQPALAAGIFLPGTVVAGIAFLLIGLASTVLMYRLWGHPYDKTTRTSAAPRWAMRLHRGLGYAFAALYLAMMWKMVPRLWTYQVEFPARTVVHILLGVTVGFLLLLKISIMRFFRHFEEWMPFLGTGILLCTVLMLVLSIPPFLREHALAHGAPGGDPFSRASQERVARLLPNAGLPDDVDLAALATEKTLRAGRDVLIDRCTACHDLRTILDRPRTPQGWWTTVERMGEKPTIFGAMNDDHLYAATAYLIAITPDLQRSMKARRAAEEAQEETLEEIAGGDIVDAGVADGGGVDAPSPIDAGGPSGDAGNPDAGVAKPAAPAVDPARARAAYERRCSECHELSEVAANPPKTKAEVKTVIRRMVENGMEASRSEIALITWWLERQYVQRGSGAVP